MREAPEAHGRPSKGNEESALKARPSRRAKCQRAWTKGAAAAGLPPVTFHALRHTHVSQLIAAGLGVVTIASASATPIRPSRLRIYGHLLKNTDERAAEVVDAAFRRARPE